MEENQDKDVAGKSRRHFLKNGATALAGLYIVPRNVLGGAGFTAPSDMLNIASIGAGGKGADDINHFYASGKANIAYLCDVDDRQAAGTVAKFPKAKYYKDFREMLDKEAKNIDAVSVSIPDHSHAVAAMNAMQRGKHVYVQKPMAHDIYEVRMLTKAARDNKVVSQMGNQGASSDGVRQLIDWYKAGLVGDITEIYCYTDRPVWPQGIPWPEKKADVPAGLDWMLWQGTAPKKEFVDNLIPFNWRGWWDYGTGALGDMGCHIIAPPFQVLDLDYPQSAECSVASRYITNWTPGYYPDSGPTASHVILSFKGKDQKPDVTLHWMDGGIQPQRPLELGANEAMGDGGNGVIFIGTKGKMMCGTYGFNPQLLPTSKTATEKVPQTIERVPGSAEGHYAAWVNACIAGFGSKEANSLSSRFDVAGPLAEGVLMGNLAIRSHDLREEVPGKQNQFTYPGRSIKLLWDGPNMKVTNFEPANQFVKRSYADGWKLGV